MIALLRLVHLRYWRHHPVQALLPALGIAIGVAAILAVDLGSRSTVDTFETTLRRLEGHATHQIRGGSEPLDPRLAARIAALPGVSGAAPVLETIALYEEPLRIYGIDPLAEATVRNLGLETETGEDGRLFAFSPRSARLMADPGAILLSQPFMRRRHIAVGDTLELAVGSRRERVFVLDALPLEVGGLEVPDNLALCDLATAQEITGRSDVDRIDLVISSLPQRPVLRNIRELLPGGVELTRTGSATRGVEKMLGPLQLNLRALSYLALFVSLFLIYNAMVIAVLRRRTTIGIVRCLGATPRAVLGAWLLEALAIGAMGTAVGLVLGLVGGRIALSGLSQTTTDLYGWVQGARFGVDSNSVAKAAAVGLLASLAAAVGPALEAAGTSPLRTTIRSELEAKTAGQIWSRALWITGPLVLLLIVFLAWPTQHPLPGYGAAVVVALLAAAAVPPLGSRLLLRLAPLLQRYGGIVVAMAARNIERSLSRTGIALAALTVALSMSVAMGTMVSSFRGELHQWIERVVRADVYISPATAEVDRDNGRLESSLVEVLRSWPGVEAVDTYRSIAARFRGQDTRCAAVEVKIYRRYTEADVIDGTAPRDYFDRLEQGQVGVSESLARRFGIQAGQRIEVHAAGKSVEFRVAGIYRDYTSDRGILMLDRRSFEVHFGRWEAQGAALYAEPGQEVASLVEELKRQVGPEYAVMIRSNRDLRQRAYAIFERTFRVARGMEFVGIAVAAIGILAALLALLLERGRELAVMRSLGLEPNGLRTLLVTESILIAVLAWIFALFAGAALSWILLHVINLRSFGWLLPFRIPWGDWLLTLGWSLAAALLASWVPLRQLQTLSVSRALREE